MNVRSRSCAPPGEIKDIVKLTEPQPRILAQPHARPRDAEGANRHLDSALTLQADGLLSGAEPSSAFKIVRARDRVSLAINPFRPDTHPSAHTGVAMITGADEAIAAHQRVAEASWREAIKGPAGAARLRQLLATVTTAA